MEEPEQQGGEQMDIEESQEIDMDNDDREHETENDRAEATDRHKTGDGTPSCSGHGSRRRSHAVLLQLVLDSDDEKTVIIPTGDG
jgi:hypothetical protein